jgi:hypothetical protein
LLEVMFMSDLRLIFRSLVYHWRVQLAVACGVAVRTSTRTMPLGFVHRCVRRWLKLIGIELLVAVTQMSAEAIRWKP